MSTEYNVWIAQNCQGVVRGFCRSKSAEMQRAFPELILCRGYYTSAADGILSHWWLKTAAGEIVDPTVRQFVAGPEGSYEEYDVVNHGPLPIGKCMNCGEEVYASANPPASSMCSKECLEDFDRHLKEVRS